MISADQSLSETILSMHGCGWKPDKIARVLSIPLARVVRTLPRADDAPPVPVVEPVAPEPPPVQGVRAPMSDEFKGLLRRLTWQYGEERALSIFDGKDPATNADLKAWRNLGRSKPHQPGEAA